jgi:hypothetical protein
MMIILKLKFLFLSSSYGSGALFGGMKVHF